MVLQIGLVPPCIVTVSYHRRKKKIFQSPENLTAIKKTKYLLKKFILVSFLLQKMLPKK